MAGADGAGCDFLLNELSKRSKLNPGGNSIILAGNYAAGGTASKTATIGHAGGWQTLASFSGVTELKSVSGSASLNIVKD